jgi:LysM repeat protein
MDQLRVWAARVLAPLAFLAAAAVLVVVVGRALDGGSSSSSPTVATEPAGSVPVTTEPAATGATATAPAERRFYRIRAGDTLEAIAAKFGTSVDELLRLNPGIDPHALSPGQRVRVA